MIKNSIKQALFLFPGILLCSADKYTHVRNTYLHMITDSDKTKKNGRDMHPRVTPSFLMKREREKESRTGMIRRGLKGRHSPSDIYPKMTGHTGQIKKEAFPANATIPSLVSNITWAAEHSLRLHRRHLTWRRCWPGPFS
ncbi:hypothetical protein LY76DRAFT_31061 [Colletotrichum caudatum]|nr:hypothetical protein LY76DRAFT_31061 [Colletotrichum caudatum]